MSKLVAKLKQLDWFEHGLALLSFVILAILVTWPTVRDINQLIISDGGDARHILSNFWHVKESVMGRQPFFDLPLLYYPFGASILTNATGPLTGFFGLPFWIFGPEVAYNATYLIGYILTGFCMYLFVRGLGIHYQPAIFSGILLMLSPICVMGFLGHIDKVFLGGLPLLFLALHQTYQRNYSVGWSIITGFVFLLILLTNGTQFAIAALSTVLYSLIILIFAPSTERWFLLKRGIIIAGCSLLLTAPVLYQLLQAANHPLVKVEINTASQYYQPDLIQFFVPSPDSFIMGEATKAFLTQYEGLILGIETLIALSWVGIILSIIAVIYGSITIRQYFLLLLCLIILSVGPYLKIMGNSEFTQYELPIIMPYAFLTSLPGFDFMRTPGRFMFAGYVFFSLTAGYGLAYLMKRWAKQRYVILIIATLFICIEYWPHPFQQEKLPITPDFYHQLAEDKDLYGVFDLPLVNYRNPYIPFSSYHQIYQMTHGKGIASGYISRTYSRHPFLPDLMQVGSTPTDLLINNKVIPTSDVLFYELNQYDYRYVVLHKPLLDDVNRERTITLTNQLFVNQLPLVDDALTTVYKVPQVSDTVMIRYDSLNWREPEPKIRWGSSPVKLHINSPITQPARLEIIPIHLHDPNTSTDTALKGISLLEYQTYDSLTQTAGFISKKLTTIPLQLKAGQQTITLTVTPGTNRVIPYSGDPNALLEFSIESINLIVGDELENEKMLRVSGEPLTVNFGNQITLLGYELFETSTTVKTVLYWQAMAPLTTTYKLFVHLTTFDGTLVTQTDAYPTGDQLLTTHWPPNEPISGENYLMIDEIDPNTPYQINIGLYNPDTSERLPVLDSSGEEQAHQVTLTAFNNLQ